MNTIKNIQDFKAFIQKNKKNIYDNAIDASSISIHDEWMEENQWDEIYQQEEKKVKNYNIGEVWWTQFPFEDSTEEKRRPAIVIDDDRIAVLAMMVTSKEKRNPFCVKIDDWKSAGIKVESWARIDRIIKMDEWRMDRKIGNLSERDLTKFMQLIVEFNTGTTHEFSIVAIKNAEEKFLQVYDMRWKCWLFPYFRSVDPNKRNVDASISNLLNIQVNTSYVAHTIHCKYSVSDDTYKIYNHKLYKLSLDDAPINMQEESFELNGMQYSWMGVEELEKDENTMEKNDDVIAFVKTKL